MTGLVGKLPAHGDFVRRGGPPDVLAALDAWLDAELTRAPELARRVDALDGCEFAARVVGEPVIGTFVWSADAVGRRFPLAATLTGPLPDLAGATTWFGHARDLMRQARDGGQPADAAAAALAALDRPAAASRPSVAPPLPTGADFAALFGEPS